MIGQINLQRNIFRLIETDSFPKFSILTGEVGSGKKLFANEIGKKLNCVIMNIGTSVSDIRDMIDNAYRITAKTVYIISDADSMSTQARNALLKIAEQPPKHVYIIMTLEDIQNTLPTIKSRASVFKMDIYSSAELREYYDQLSDIANEEWQIIVKVCKTPGEIKLFKSQKPLEFYEFAEKVVNNIAVVSGANSFKISQNIRLKDSDEGYDLFLFWKIFCNICFENASQDIIKNIDKSSKWLNGIKITSNSLTALRTYRSINKLMLFDKWILDIREAWCEWT